ncbi:hypothetical protein [Actinosynnema sp. NPDC023587]
MFYQPHQHTTAPDLDPNPKQLLVVAVVQAISALSVAARNPELPNDILL